MHRSGGMAVVPQLHDHHLVLESRCVGVGLTGSHDSERPAFDDIVPANLDVRRQVDRFTQLAADEVFETSSVVEDRDHTGSMHP